MALRLIYQMFTKLLGWIVLHTRSDTTKDIEILVLRHQLTVLHRRTPRLRMSWTDRAVIAVLTRLLPVRRRLGLLINPATILRWHRQPITMALPADLLRRRWWPGLVVVTAAPGRRYLPANAGHRGRAVHGERAQAALQVEQANADDRREDHQAKKIDHRSCSSSCMRLRGRSTFESA
jgi:hypothetical protein